MTKHTHTAVCVNNRYYSISCMRFSNAVHNSVPESGRSLVEILGVLAIMGILTIGGIAGFNYAINIQRANATVGYVNELAVLGTGQMLAGNTPKLLDYPDHTPSGYPAKITTEDNSPNAFYIEIDEVPTPVCTELISRLDGWKMVNDIGFFDNIHDCPTDTTAHMWFKISANANKEAAPGSCADDADCKALFGNTYTCNTQKGTCELLCRAGYTKTPFGCCRDELVFNGGCCESGTIENSQCCQQIEGAKRCCPAGTFFMSTTLGCVSCDDPRFPELAGAGTFSHACKICPNRSLIGRICAPTKDECLDGAVLVDNECYCPMDKPVMTFKDGRCHTCDYAISPGPLYEKYALWRQPYGLRHKDVWGENSWGSYCNRFNQGGYSFSCSKGAIGVSGAQSYVSKNGPTVRLSGNGACISCSQVDISQLKYKAWCLSCGGSWSGEWDSGSCTP